MGLNDNKKVLEYINNVCSKIKNHRVHKEIKQELLAHIEDAIGEYQSEGIKQDEAIERAINNMGDAEVIGQELNKVHKAGPEWSILIMTILFSVLGLVAMYFIQTKGALSHNFQVFNRSIVFSLLGMATVVGLYFIDYRKIQPFSKYIYGATLLILLYTSGFGTQVNGIRAWLNIGPISINFIEISAFLFIISLAGLFDGWDWSQPKNIIYGLALGTIPAIFMLKAPALSVGAIYFIAFFVLMIISGLKLKHAFLLVFCGLCLTIGAIISEPYRIERFLIFTNPAKDPEGAGWMNIQLGKITHLAGAFGQGFTFNPTMLPEIHTEFIFTYIVYTFGWVVGIILAALVTVFLIRIVKIATIVNNNYGKLLVSGLATIFTVQFVWNILMNLNLMPMTGVGLPFISFGGSQFIMDMMVIGIITNIYKWKNTSQNFDVCKK